MSITAWIVVGLIAGFIATQLIPGNDLGGIIVTTLLGIAGAFAWVFLGRATRFLGLTNGHIV